MEAQFVKIAACNEFRRVPISYFDFTSFPTFCDQVRKLFGNDFPGLEQVNGPSSLVYVDDEGDTVAVKGCAELAASMTSQDGPILRYIVATPNAKRPPPPQRRWNLRDLPRDFATLNHAAVEQIQAGELERARDVLHMALNAYPCNHVLYYNLACCESMLGGMQAAVECLRSAFYFGYRNVEHLFRDPHLLELRKTEEFRKLMRQFEHPPPNDRIYAHHHHPHSQPSPPQSPATAPATTGTAINIGFTDFPPYTKIPVTEKSAPTTATSTPDVSFPDDGVLDFSDSELSTADWEARRNSPETLSDVECHHLHECSCEHVAEASPRFPYTEALSTVVAMGFTKDAAMLQLLKHSGDAGKAVDELLSEANHTKMQMAVPPEGAF